MRRGNEEMQEYEKVLIDIIVFDEEDVIITSNQGDIDGNPIPGGGSN